MMFATGQSRDKRRWDQAFTLVELILVMAILSVVVTVAAPSLGNFFQGRKQESEARRILSLIRYGQSRAASEGIPTILWFDVKKGTYGLELMPGYSAFEDTKYIELEMDSDLQMNVRYSVMRSINRTRSLPAIVIEPDGSFDQTSPEYIAIQAKNSNPVYVIKALNGLCYVISHQNEAIEKAFR